jgi:hypothetical protein
MEKDVSARLKRAYDRSKGASKGAGGRATKRRSPSYSYDSRSRSPSYSRDGDSFKKKGEKGGRRSRSAASVKKDSRSRSKASDWSKSQKSPRGEITSRVLRSRSAGSQEPKLEETNGHAEEKNPEAPVEEPTLAEVEKE